MPSISDLGYTLNRIDQNNYRKDTPDVTENIPPSQINQYIIDKSIDWNKTTIDTLNIGQYMRSGQTGFDAGIGWWIGNDGGTPKLSIGNSAGDKITWNGSVFTIVGTLTATSIHIPDQTTANSFHTDSSGNSWWGCNVANWTATHDNATAYVLNTGVAKLQNVTITGGSVATSTFSGVIAQGNLNVSNRGWSQTCAFSMVDSDTVQWGAGVLTSADGTAYNITGGNTGNMAAKTYIYLDTAVSLTVYQTTTTALTAIGAGKVLVATAQNNTTEAVFTVMDGQGGQNIDASAIVANSITANELATSILYAGSINIDTAGNIRSGQTAYNTGTGWWIGNVTGTPKLSIGDPAGRHLLWTGTDLVINGYVQNSKGAFGGDGSDGAIAGALTVTGSNNTVIVKNYTTFAPGANTVTITPTGCILIIKVQGNCDLTGTTFSFAGKGAVGGTPNSDDGDNAITTLGLVSKGIKAADGGFGGTNTSYGGGGGGASIFTNGSNGNAGAGSVNNGPYGAGGTATFNGSVYTYAIAGKTFVLATGSGGGTGCGKTLVPSGGGGAGGGCVYLEVYGNLTFSGTTITVAGSNGTATSVGGGGGGEGNSGGGGGGGGGIFICLYNGTLTGTCTPTVTGGTGGAGTVNNDSVGGGTGGTGGAGGAGAYLIALNTTFA
jgi:hypothetical protein